MVFQICPEFIVICEEAGLIGTYLPTPKTDTNDINLDHLVKVLLDFFISLLLFPLQLINQNLSPRFNICWFWPALIFTMKLAKRIFSCRHSFHTYKLAFSNPLEASVLPPPSPPLSHVDVLSASHFLNGFRFLTVCNYFGTQTVLDLASGNPFKLVLYSVTSFHCLPSYFFFFFLSTRCSKLILYLPCPCPGISHFSEEPWYAHC